MDLGFRGGYGVLRWIWGLGVDMGVRGGYGVLGWIWGLGVDMGFWGGLGACLSNVEGEGGNKAVEVGSRLISRTS